MACVNTRSRNTFSKIIDLMSRSTLEQETLHPLLSTGWFQERIRVCFNKLKASDKIELKYTCICIVLYHFVVFFVFYPFYSDLSYYFEALYGTY
jgi:hypothetical protein